MSNVSPRKITVAGARCFEQRKLLCRVSPRVASVFAEVFTSLARPALLHYLHAKPTSSPFATSLAGLRKRSYPSGSCGLLVHMAEVNHARLQGQVVVGAPRRRAAPGCQRHEALCHSAASPPSERIRTLRPARTQRKVATDARSQRSVSLTERPRSTPAEAEG